MAGPSILLVENIEAFQKTVCDHLKPHGYKLTVARTPAEAKSKAKDKRFAAAVVDVRLLNENDRFDWSGLALARELGEQMPVIILTAYDDAADIERAYTTAPGAPRIRAFISKNTPNWYERLHEALDEQTQPRGGIREWISEHWQDVKTVLKTLLDAIRQWKP